MSMATNSESDSIPRVPKNETPENLECARSLTHHCRLCCLVSARHPLLCSFISPPLLAATATSKNSLTVVHPKRGPILPHVRSGTRISMTFFSLISRSFNLLLASFIQISVDIYFAGCVLAQQTPLVPCLLSFELRNLREPSPVCSFYAFEIQSLIIHTISSLQQSYFTQVFFSPMQALFHWLHI